MTTVFTLTYKARELHSERELVNQNTFEAPSVDLAITKLENELSERDLELISLLHIEQHGTGLNFDEDLDFGVF